MSGIGKVQKWTLGIMTVAVWSALSTGTAEAGYRIERVATDLDQPVQVAQAPGDESSIYVLENQTNDFNDDNSSGQIVKIDLATGAKSSLLRIEDISKPAQGGTHGLAFHPDFATNGKFYLSWVKNPDEGNTQPQMRLDEYQVTVGPPTLLRTLYDLPNVGSASWHGINWIGFKPGVVGAEREYLYITTGDGDLQANNPNFLQFGQDLSSTRGKVLRIDLAAADAYPSDLTRNYGFPMSNPYADDGDSETLGEIYHSGLRNPWRASFDSLTGDLLIGDVGFNAAEEINFAKAGEAGVDFGWSKREGTAMTSVMGVGGEQDDSVDPIFELMHDNDQGVTGVGSITGGIVYRGPVAELYGEYFFAEAKAGEILSGRFDRDTAPENFDGNNLTGFTIRTDHFNARIVGEGEINTVVSLDEDAAGNLYLSDFSDGTLGNQFGRGEIYRLVLDLSGDFNDNGTVDELDLLKWQADYAQGGGSDADDDEDTDGTDYLAWQRSLSFLPPAAGANASVPEPATAAQLATALAILASGLRWTAQRSIAAEH